MRPRQACASAQYPLGKTEDSSFSQNGSFSLRPGAISSALFFGLFCHVLELFFAQIGIGPFWIMFVWCPCGDEGTSEFESESETESREPRAESRESGGGGAWQVSVSGSNSREEDRKSDSKGESSRPGPGRGKAPPDEGALRPRSRRSPGNEYRL